MFHSRINKKLALYVGRFSEQGSPLYDAACTDIGAKELGILSIGEDCASTSGVFLTDIDVHAQPTCRVGRTQMQ